MLIERWERLRGYDRWPEVKATIEWDRTWGLPMGGEVGPQGYVPVSSGTRTLLKQVHIRYHDPHGTAHSRSIWLFFGSGVSLLKPGDSFYIRCSPENPKRIYLREQTTGTLGFAALLGPMALLIWVSLRSR